MKTVLVIENTEELLAVISGDKDNVTLPADAKLIFEDNFNRVRLQADGFEFIARDADVDKLIVRLAQLAGIHAYVA